MSNADTIRTNVITLGRAYVRLIVRLNDGADHAANFKFTK